MSTHTSTAWTCDRCGAGALLPEREQPAKWAAIYEVEPPLMNPTESNRKPVQLCPECRKGLGVWFTEGRAA